MPAMQPHNHPTGPGVAALPMQTLSRLDEAGAGLDDATHRVLTYSQLRSREPNPDQRAPGREIELHLTGNMERYMWSFDGKKYSEGVEPIVLTKDERVRLTFVNDTMMAHPIHLHGMYFDVVNSMDGQRPRKHTILVKPAEKVSVDLTADALGDWAFHCHLLYHMHAGMFRVVSVRESAMPMNLEHHHSEAQL
jgi:FtsP/CotA-like multicopper oxidase with cupredoxin domain